MSIFGPDKDVRIDYKDIDTLLNFIGDTGKIESGKKTGNWPKVQRRLRIAIQRARHLALLPAAGDHLRVTSPAPDRTGQSQPQREEPVETPEPGAVTAEHEEQQPERAVAAEGQEAEDSAGDEAQPIEAAADQEPGGAAVEEPHANDDADAEADAEKAAEGQSDESVEGATSVEQSGEEPDRTE